MLTLNTQHENTKSNKNLGQKKVTQKTLHCLLRFVFVKKTFHEFYMANKASVDGIFDLISMLKNIVTLKNE